MRPGEEPRAGEPAVDPPLRAGQDPGGDGPRADLQPAGLDPDAQRAAARPGDPAALPVPALHVPDRRADPDRRRQPARVARGRPGRCTTPTARDPDFGRMVLLGPQHGRPAQPHDGGLQRRRALAALFRPAVRQRSSGRATCSGSCSATCSSSRCRSSSRVVFLATPHRGSDMSRGVVGRVGTSLIADSDHIHKLLHQLVKDNPDAFDSRRFRRFPTSIETLEPGFAHPDGPAGDEAGPAA